MQRFPRRLQVVVDPEFVVLERLPRQTVVAGIRRRVVDEILPGVADGCRFEPSRVAIGEPQRGERSVECGPCGFDRRLRDGLLVPERDEFLCRVVERGERAFLPLLLGDVADDADQPAVVETRERQLLRERGPVPPGTHGFAAPLAGFGQRRKHFRLEPLDLRFAVAHPPRVPAQGHRVVVPVGVGVCLVHEGVLVVPVQDRDPVDRGFDRTRPLVELPLRVVPLDRVQDPVCEEFVLLVARLLLEVVGRTGGDGVAGDRLRPLAGVQDEREVRPRFADRFEELDPVLVGHVVVADDTVDRVPTQQLRTAAWTVRGLHLEPVVLAGEKRRDHLREPRLVVDV